MESPRVLRMGMVGGGPGAFIGPVHRMAAELDGRIKMVAGAFSQSSERSREAGESYRIDLARAYESYQTMLVSERERRDGIDFVVIATPNHLHLPVAVAALEAGFPVVSDKPATATYEEVQTLQAAVAKAGLPFALTHTYAGYALIREARSICATGQLGAIRKVAVEYLQGWLSRPLEKSGQKQAVWRSDPALNGQNGSIDWRQQDPNRLRVKWVDGPEEIRHAGASYLSEDARAVTRLPGGHPEGYIEAFAVLYREFADAFWAWKRGEASPLPATLPGITAAVRGMRFIERIIESNKAESWIEF